MTNDQVMALFQQFLAALQSNSATVAPAPAPDSSRPILTPSIDPFLPAGTAGTTYLEVTKHVLSNPQSVEGIAGYAYRVSDQAHAGEGIEGGQVAARNKIGLGYGIVPPNKVGDTVTPGLLAADGSNWPIAVDFFFNRNAYLAAWAPDQLAKEIADQKAQADAQAVAARAQQGTPS